MNKKGITLKSWQLVLIVIIVITIISVAIIVTKYAEMQRYKNIDRSSKYGITLDVIRDDAAQQFESNIKEDDNSLCVSTQAKFESPTPGIVKMLDWIDSKGVTSTDISSDITIKISFPENSFMKDGVFVCPMIFTLGKHVNGDNIIIDGYDYIGQKEKFEEKLINSFDEGDVKFLPKNTNIADYVRVVNQNSPYKWEIPEDRSAIYATPQEFNIDAKYEIKEAQK